MAGDYDSQTRRLRMCQDITADPEYARRALECLDLGLPADACDEAVAGARRLQIRMQLSLPAEASDEEVTRARQRRAEADHCFWRNRDIG